MGSLFSFEHPKVLLSPIFTDHSLVGSRWREARSLEKPAFTFPLVLVGDVLPTRSNTEVVQGVIVRIPIFMVDLKAIWNCSSQQSPDDSVCSVRQVNGAYAYLEKDGVRRSVWFDGWFPNRVSLIVGEPHVPDHLGNKMLHWSTFPCERPGGLIVVEALGKVSFRGENFYSANLLPRSSTSFPLHDCFVCSGHTSLANGDSFLRELGLVGENLLSAITSARPLLLRSYFEIGEKLHRKFSKPLTSKVDGIAVEFDFLRRDNILTLGFIHDLGWMDSSEDHLAATGGPCAFIMAELNSKSRRATACL